MKDLLVYSDEVKSALAAGGAVVALESTIISHGMPFPHNLEVAREVEKTIRNHGAVPATICIMAGRVHIGLTDSELEKFASLTDVVKCSRRDLPFVLSQKLNGATTVAGTMLFAEMAGISVFATGGIGGVHRGAELSMDVSADLYEFTLSRVAVVSAGAKAILDLPKTMEYLETLGVPVIGYGTNELPAFYTRTSGIALPMRLDTPQEVAELIQKNKTLGMKGLLIANPIPEDAALESSAIEKQIQSAVQEAESKNISGKELTPFLLKKLNEVTQGKSQEANRALVLNNAKVAAEIAEAGMRYE